MESHSLDAEPAQADLVRVLEVLASDADLDAILGTVVTFVRVVTGSPAAAVGVVGSSGTVEQFAAAGLVEPETVAAAPRRDGVLAAVLAGQAADGDRVPCRAPITISGAIAGALWYEPADADLANDAAYDGLLGALALAVGAVIGNVRLHREADLQRGWLQASAEIGAQLATARGDEGAELIGARVMELAAADSVMLGMVSPDGASIEVMTALGGGAAGFPGALLPLAGTTTGKAIETGTPMSVPDLAGTGGQRSPLLEQYDAGPMMVLPLITAGVARGAVAVVRRRGSAPFTPFDLEHAAGFALHAGVALELAESRRSEQRMALLEDRDRIAMDLHDHVIQELFAVGLSLQATAAELGRETTVAPRLLRSVDDLDRTIRRIRTSIFELRGSLSVAGGGLRKVVLGIADELTPALGYRPRVTFSGPVDVALDDALADDVMACVRESLSNVARHAEADDVRVEVVAGTDGLTVLVSDDGRGVGDATRSSGTANLRARAERRGGTFELAARPGGGTTVRWSIPLPEGLPG